MAFSIAMMPGGALPHWEPRKPVTREQIAEYVTDPALAAATLAELSRLEAAGLVVPFRGIPPMEGPHTHIHLTARYVPPAGMGYSIAEWCERYLTGTLPHVEGNA